MTGLQVVGGGHLLKQAPQLASSHRLLHVSGTPAAWQHVFGAGQVLTHPGGVMVGSHFSQGFGHVTGIHVPFRGSHWVQGGHAMFGLGRHAPAGAPGTAWQVSHWLGQMLWHTPSVPHSSHLRQQVAFPVLGLQHGGFLVLRQMHRPSILTDPSGQTQTPFTPGPVCSQVRQSQHSWGFPGLHRTPSAAHS
jgi:hypothetical protein